jgi:hypothetical protein
MNAVYHYRTQAYSHNLAQPTFETVKIRPLFENGRSNVIGGGVVHNIPYGELFPINDMRLFTRDQLNNGTVVNLPTPNLYRVLMHEMGHVTHILKSPKNAALSVGHVGESWATCVEYYFTLPYHPDVVAGAIDQDRTELVGGNWKYTSYFIDLRDNTNQLILQGDGVDNTEDADDEVSGYTLEQMQDALDFRTSLGGVASHLENNYSNPTEGELDDLLIFYEELKDNHN